LDGVYVSDKGTQAWGKLEEELQEYLFPKHSLHIFYFHFHFASSNKHSNS
jgi:hypothetical protein